MHALQSMFTMPGIGGMSGHANLFSEKTMSDRASFTDMITFGFRTMAWRPVHSAVLIGAASLLNIAYYMWAQSESGQGWASWNAQSVVAMQSGSFGAYLPVFAVSMVIGLLISAVFYAGIYRVMLREDARAVMPFGLGRDEVNLILVFLALAGIFLLFMIALMVVMFIVIFVLGLVLAPIGGGATTDLLAASIGFIVVGLMALPIGYFFGRVAVSVPLTIRMRAFSLGGWKASKGMGWSLLGAHVVVYILLVVLMLVFMQGGMSGGYQFSDPSYDQLVASIANPYGDWLFLAAPVQTVATFVFMGPTAAVAAKHMSPESVAKTFE